MSLSLETMTTSQPAVGGLAAERADHVVGFEAGVLDDGDAEGVDEALDIGDLLDQVGRRFGAVGFVFGVFLFAVGFAEAFEDGGHVLRLEGLGELAQHVVEDENGFGGEAGGGAHGRRLHAGAGVVGAEDEAVGVDEEEAGWALGPS